MARLVPGYTYKGHTYDLDCIKDPDKGRFYIDEIVFPDGRRDWLSWCKHSTYDPRHFDAMVDIGISRARVLMRQATGHLPMTPFEIESYLIKSPVTIMGVPFRADQIATAVPMVLAALVAFPFVMAVAA